MVLERSLLILELLRRRSSFWRGEGREENESEWVKAKES